jgi:hypothetical protein
MISTEEGVDVDEEVQINRVRVMPLIATKGRVTKNGQPVEEKVRLVVDSRHTHSRGLYTLPSTEVSSSDKKAPAKYPAPQVAFPFITELDLCLEASFRLIKDTLPVLPCELASAAVKLPALAWAGQKTLVIALEDTLVTPVVSQPHSPSQSRPLSQSQLQMEQGATKKRSKAMERLQSEDKNGIAGLEFRVRPHAKEFLRDVAQFYELIVRRGISG